jgi:hypothetical protein
VTCVHEAKKFVAQVMTKHRVFSSYLLSCNLELFFLFLSVGVSAENRFVASLVHSLLHPPLNSFAALCLHPLPCLICPARQSWSALNNLTYSVPSLLSCPSTFFRFYSVFFGQLFSFFILPYCFTFWGKKKETSFIIFFRDWSFTLETFLFLFPPRLGRFIARENPSVSRWVGLYYQQERERKKGRKFLFFLIVFFSLLFETFLVGLDD